jgi:hypothetical protein
MSIVYIVEELALSEQRYGCLLPPLLVLARPWWNKNGTNGIAGITYYSAGTLRLVILS